MPTEREITFAADANHEGLLAALYADIAAGNDPVWRVKEVFGANGDGSTGCTFEAIALDPAGNRPSVSFVDHLGALPGSMCDGGNPAAGDYLLATIDPAGTTAGNVLGARSPGWFANAHGLGSGGASATRALVSSGIVDGRPWIKMRVRSSAGSYLGAAFLGGYKCIVATYSGYMGACGTHADMAAYYDNDHMRVEAVPRAWITGRHLGSDTHGLQGAAAGGLIDGAVVEHTLPVGVMTLCTPGVTSSDASFWGLCGIRPGRYHGPASAKGRYHAVRSTGELGGVTVTASGGTIEAIGPGNPAE